MTRRTIQSLRRVVLCWRDLREHGGGRDELYLRWPVAGGAGLEELSAKQWEDLIRQEEPGEIFRKSGSIF